MTVTLNMGVEGVSYQPSSAKSRDGYPRHKVSLPIGASIPRHIEKVFDVHANERTLADAVRPNLSNPYVTVPARYVQLFAEIETASAQQSELTGEPGRILESARTLLSAMKEDFAAFTSARNALIGI